MRIEKLLGVLQESRGRYYWRQYTGGAMIASPRLPNGKITLFPKWGLGRVVAAEMGRPWMGNERLRNAASEFCLEENRELREKLFEVLEVRK